MSDQAAESTAPPPVASSEQRSLAEVAIEVVSVIASAPAARLQAETSLAAFVQSVEPPEQARHAAEVKRLEATREAMLAAIDAKATAVLAQATQRHSANAAKINEEERRTLERAEDQLEAELDKLQSRMEEQIWTADSIFEEQRPSFLKEHQERKQQLQSMFDGAHETLMRARDLLGRALVMPTENADGSSPALGADPMAAFAAEASVADELFVSVRRMSFALILRNKIAHAACLLLVVLLSAGAVSLTVGWAEMTGPLIVIGALALSALLQGAIFFSAGRSLRGTAQAVADRGERLKQLLAATLRWSDDTRERLTEAASLRHQQEVASVRSALAERRAALQAQLPHRLERVQAAAAELRAKNDGQLAQIKSNLAKSVQDARAQVDARHAMTLGREVDRHTTRAREISAVVEARRTALRNDWHTAQGQVVRDLQRLGEIERRQFLPWSDPSWERFDGASEPRSAVSLGHITIPLSGVKGALPVSPDLAWPAGTPRIMHVPVTLSIPTQASLLLEAGMEGREAGVALLQEAMLRLLTMLPPGKARFTIFDPVGLGESFAAFMHLSDEAEHLVGERIWTEQRQMEQRLTDLCEHMETVIQKFLRNEYADLAAYNRQAGEIAEPYRFLVMADFPAGLSEAAIRRLNSVITSGARCGVFTLLLRDTRQSVPSDLDMRELRARALNLVWKSERFSVVGTPLEPFPFTARSPPSNDRATALLKRIAASAKRAKRVEVPFAVIAPTPGRLWSETTDDSITVPLGRSGATRLQSLVLGVGTSQHALIAGKTGSGKSTLLHALITNLALRFSPDQADVWLIDFKKGVEFRTYAAHGLPHARVVAVESDREFGLSVLRGLDTELRTRGDLFRAVGVQDLAGFRRLRPTERMPRTLLIVDEFQELFTEDDKVSEESGLLLDRLVRQGRAFGIHVVLGSQTLGGAYSIARATMGQMGVRIALQCNEADSQLILADDNVAARLLSRPGEAIYNDAGGLVEGNNPFQVVWLADADRDRLLDDVRALEQSHPCAPRPPMIVFEGSAPALLEANALLLQAANRRGNEVLLAPRLWLGDAVAIQEPTSVPLRRQSGSNMLVVGQREDASAGVAAAALVSVAAQCGSDARVVLLDGTPVDDAACDKLAGLRRELGLRGDSGGIREADALLMHVAEEVRRRAATGESRLETILLVIHGLHRFRSLRRNEDDYGFGSSGSAAVSGDKLLAEILRDGPTVGVHVLVTVDSATNLARSVDRNALREFSWRALFQVSATDSSTLIDSPAASKLGPQRALLHQEDAGSHEKFRPYAFPTGSWLSKVALSQSIPSAARSLAPTRAELVPPGSSSVDATSAEVQPSAGSGSSSGQSGSGADDVEVPKKVGRYRVERLLGSGSYGSVFLAFDDQLQRHVAVKVPRRTMVSTERQVQDFLREARAAAALDHPGVVPVYDVGSSVEHPCFVVCKFISGSDLETLTKTKRLPLREAVAIVASVADALHAAHRRGLVHRDVKPSNLLMDADGRALIADFGLVLSTADAAGGAALAGTPAFMSPEQARGESATVDGRADIFGLGAVLYTLITGRRPFVGGSRKEVLEQVIHAEPPAPRALVPTIPESLERVCLRALAKRPADRYGVAAEMAQALRTVLADLIMPDAPGA
ncbi:MAG: cell division protein FtsK [Planctomycetes bacterium]|nr:cell division protein FtsK [Planctomycetota bacterium]